MTKFHYRINPWACLHLTDDVFSSLFFFCKMIKHILSSIKYWLYSNFFEYLYQSSYMKYFLSVVWVWVECCGLGLGLGWVLIDWVCLAGLPKLFNATSDTVLLMKGLLAAVVETKLTNQQKNKCFNVVVHARPTFNVVFQLI